MQLKAKKLVIQMSVSNELIADSVSFEERLGKAMVKALGYFLDKAFLSAAGAGAPVGIGSFYGCGLGGALALSRRPPRRPGCKPSGIRSSPRR